jgi:hypothetical protein
VAGKPNIIAVMLLAIMTGLHVLAQVRTNAWVLATIDVGLRVRDKLLENCAVIDLVNSLAEELRRRSTQHVPILLEDAKVSTIACLPVT